MNRYVAEGIVRDMRAGKTVIYAAETKFVAQGNFALIRDLAHEVAGDVESTRDRIQDFGSGGSVRLGSINAQADHSWRGLKADVVYVDYRDRASLHKWWERVGRGMRECEILTD